MADIKRHGAHWKKTCCNLMRMKNIPRMRGVFYFCFKKKILCASLVIRVGGKILFFTDLSACGTRIWRDGDR